MMFHRPPSVCMLQCDFFLFFFFAKCIFKCDILKSNLSFPPMKKYQFTVEILENIKKWQNNLNNPNWLLRDGQYPVLWYILSAVCVCICMYIFMGMCVCMHCVLCVYMWCVFMCMCYICVHICLHVGVCGIYLGVSMCIDICVCVVCANDWDQWFWQHNRHSLHVPWGLDCTCCFRHSPFPSSWCALLFLYFLVFFCKLLLKMESGSAAFWSMMGANLETVSLTAQMKKQRPSLSQGHPAGWVQNRSSWPPVSRSQHVVSSSFRCLFYSKSKRGPEFHQEANYISGVFSAWALAPPLP